jgi:hypothetical protein
MRAAASAGKSLLQHSQLGRKASIHTSKPWVFAANSGRLCVLSTVYHRFDPVAIDQHSGSLENRTFPEHGIVTRPAALKQPPLTLRYARMALT